MGLSPKEMEEIQVKINMYKTLYTWDLGLPDDNTPLSDDKVALVERRVQLIRNVFQQFLDKGLEKDASILIHLVGDLEFRLRSNDRLRWSKLSDAEKSYQNMIRNHPEWRVRSNIILDMTGAIQNESQSTDVAVFQAAVIGAILAFAMPGKLPGKLPGATAPLKPPTVLSKIAAFTGTRDQFRAYVLRKLIAEPNNPLKFLLNQARTGWQSAKRTHDVLIERYDIWEAGHIQSDKIGGVRLMIQTAWENQIQSQSIERPSIGGAVLDNPVVEVGGFPVAKSTVKTWELAGKLPKGTADSAPVVTK